MDKIEQSDHVIFLKTEETVAFYLANALKTIKAECPEIYEDHQAAAQLAGQLVQAASIDLFTGVFVKRVEALKDEIAGIRAVILEELVE